MILSFSDLHRVKEETTGKVVYARGAFDIFHHGHVAFLEFAKQQGDILVVGVISDEVIRQNKGKDRPIKDEYDRLRVVNAIKGVGYAFIVPPPTAQATATEAVITTLRPDVFVLYDEEPEHTRHFAKLLSEYGIALVLDQSNKVSSTSNLIQKIRRTQ